ncbi:MAG: hypothetical protein ACJA08_002485 [Cyclobacteriaceae bacterium]|jgi:hypothetical protein
MDIRKCFFLVLFIFSCTLAFAQNTREVEAPKAPKPVYRAEKDTKFSFFKKKENKKDTDVAEFRERMKKVAKKKRKEAKLAEKPQYTDALYFGHKKPPKKHKNGKKKFCKECGLTH